jgi:EAL domain-containing protein (putative c-di-GMP-specific phosphodiesterase class I)
MAKALNIKIIAERVELKVQQEYLKAANCDIIQGYYYAKPLSIKDLERFIQKS